MIENKPFFLVHPQPKNQPDHIVKFENTLDVLMRDGSIIFKDYAAARRLKQFLLVAIHSQTKFGFDQKSLRVENIKRILDYLRGDHNELPAGFTRAPALTEDVRNVLNGILPNTEHMGEKRAGEALDVLKKLLQRLEEFDSQRPRTVPASSLPIALGTHDPRGDSIHLREPISLRICLLREIASFLGPKETVKKLCLVNRTMRAALSSEKEALDGALTGYYDAPSFDFRMASLKKRWAQDPARRACALAGWAKSLWDAPPQVASYAFPFLLDEIEKLPKQVRRDGVTELCRNLHAVGKRDAYRATVSRILALLECRDCPDAVIALANSYDGGAKEAEDMSQFTVIVDLVQALDEKLHHRCINTLLLVWTNLSSLRSGKDGKVTCLPAERLMAMLNSLLAMLTEIDSMKNPERRIDISFALTTLGKGLWQQREDVRKSTFKHLLEAVRFLRTNDKLSSQSCNAFLRTLRAETRVWYVQTDKSEVRLANEEIDKLIQSMGVSDVSFDFSTSLPWKAGR